MLMAASHSQGKIAVDKIFGANAQALQAMGKFGKTGVKNCTQGVLLDEEEKLVLLPTVETAFRSLASADIAGYAPIRGLPEFLGSIVDITFGDYRPNTFIEAVATSGGTGALHHTIWNYSEIGDTVLTTDWFWSPYRVLCQEALRKLDIFAMFDRCGGFNVPALDAKMSAVFEKQNRLILILNTPAHNPTGYSLTDAEWDEVLLCAKKHAANPDRRITLLVDAAYLDFSGDPAGRRFFRKFEKLPANILVIVAVSLSKSLTLYGQRTGAMIGISSDAETIGEFININGYTSRATWSNINRAAMKTLSVIASDPPLLAKLTAEREDYLGIIRKRAELFMTEAGQVGLKCLPYTAGFFITIYADNPDLLCDRLHRDNVFLVPMDKGVRLAVCALSSAKIPGLATAIKRAAGSPA
ncbi:MAG: aminotransferase class I/II-fold pyridoxal phosphate-dependent enzyme [Negativicutes bacterium]|nr:aminotransferase class I/II-fold pyridoxal phosphate-dependent enzyme [Negativicutes bacterium]